MISHIEVADLELDLSFLDKGQSFSLLLIHNKNCVPTLEKYSRKLASFASYGFTKKYFEFETKDELTGDIIILEILHKNRWVEFKKFEYNKGRHKFPRRKIPKDSSGVRIKYLSPTGRVIYSRKFSKDGSGEFCLGK